MSLKGHLLIASPHLSDPNFHHCVILMIHHGDDGTFGLVINRPTDSHVQDFWHTVSEVPCESLDYLYVGGPVSGPLMALHCDAQLSEIEVLPGLYFAAQRDNIEKLVMQDAAEYRLFIGHSGWSSGQLENELSEGAWFTKPAQASDVFGEMSDLWKQSTEHVGLHLLSSSLHIRQFPQDPTVN